jgi:hypothetical protein
MIFAKSAQKNDKFIPSDACHHIDFPYGIFHAIGRFDKQQVSKSMTILVVQGLEIVEIDIHDDAVHPRPFLDNHGLFEFFREQSSVWKIRESIMQRQFQDLVLQVFAFGDIVECPKHQDGFAIGSPCNDFSTIMDPYPMPVPMSHPAIEFVVREFSGKMFFQQFRRFLQIVGMIEFFPCSYAYRLDFIQVVSEQSGPMLIEHGFPGLNVPFPGSDVHPLDNAFVFPRHVPDFPRSIFVFGNVLSFRHKICDVAMLVKNGSDGKIDIVGSFFGIEMNDGFPYHLSFLGFVNGLDEDIFRIRRIGPPGSFPKRSPQDFVDIGPDEVQSRLIDFDKHAFRRQDPDEIP